MSCTSIGTGLVPGGVFEGAWADVWVGMRSGDSRRRRAQMAAVAGKIGLLGSR
jgi:hypothetical protein